MKRLTVQMRLVSLLGLFVFLWSAAHAQITPSADSYTNTVDPTTNYGAKTLLDVDGASQITYVQFNLTSIPTTASVSQATLKLYVNSVLTAGSFNVDYINSAWAENTIDSSNAPPLGTTIASQVALTTAEKNQYILINVTSAVQAWLSGSETNNGLALVANGTFNATFDSKENTTTSHAPELDVAYAGGEGTITGITTASGSGLTGGGTSGTLNIALTNTCGASQVLQWNGSSWACSSAGTGTVTSVGSGSGLTGGPVTGSGTLSIATGGVSNAMLTNPSLTVATSSPLTGGGVVALGGTIAIGLQTCSSNQILQFATGAWTCSDLPGSPGGIQEFTTSGTLTVPSGVGHLLVEMWGGGGGGGGGVTGAALVLGGGAGAGGYTRATVPVTPGAIYNIVVGSGGPAGTNGVSTCTSTACTSVSGSPGENGGSSEITDSSSNVLAQAAGGAGGNPGSVEFQGFIGFPSFGSGGAGGVGTSSTNSVGRTGGSGQTGSTTPPYGAGGVPSIGSIPQPGGAGGCEVGGPGQSAGSAGYILITY